MSFINDIAFDERVDELEVEGDLRVGGDILLHGEFPKMDQKIASLNSSISSKAKQSDLDVVVVTLNMKADHEEVVASLSLKADQSELDSALSSVDSRIDGVDGLLGTKANQSALDALDTRASILEDDLTSNASRVSVLETDLSDNSSRVIVLEEDLTSNALRVSVLETDSASNAGRVSVLEEDLASNAGRVSVLETDLASNAGRVDVLETDLVSNAARVDVLETDLVSNAARVDVLETDLGSNAARVDVVETDLASNAGRVSTLETTVASQGSSIQNLYDADYAPKAWVNDKDYATEDYVDNAVITAAAIDIAISAAIDAGLTAFASAYTSSTVDTKNAAQNAFVELTYVKKPVDYFVYAPTFDDGTPTGEDPTLKSYTDKKIDQLATNITRDKLDDFKKGKNNSSLQLRNYSFDPSTFNRNGTQKIEFLRTTPTEAFGANKCNDWRIIGNQYCGLDIYTKATDPNLGAVYEGNVIEFKPDRDVNIVKEGGLKVNGVQVVVTTDLADLIEVVNENIRRTELQQEKARITNTELLGQTRTEQMRASTNPLYQAQLSPGRQGALNLFNAGLTDFSELDPLTLQRD